MELPLAIFMTAVWIWLIVIAFKSDQMSWGFVMLFFSPAALFYGPFNWGRAKIPYILFIVTVILLFMGVNSGHLETRI